MLTTATAPGGVSPPGGATRRQPGTCEGVESGGAGGAGRLVGEGGGRKARGGEASAARTAVEGRPAGGSVAHVAAARRPPRRLTQTRSHPQQQLNAFKRQVRAASLTAARSTHCND